MFIFCEKCAQVAAQKKTFFLDKKARLFNTSKHLQPILMFVIKACNLPERSVF
jgi:hypothetical protein